MTTIHINPDDHYLIEKKMGKEENTLFKILAVIGGAYLFAELIRVFVKPVTYYSCPKCNSDIVYGQKQCNICSVDLGWPNQNNELNKSKEEGVKVNQ